MGEEDDRKDARPELPIDQPASRLPATRAGSEPAAGALTPPGTAVCLAHFKKVYLGSTCGESFRFPSMVGTDDQERDWSGSYSIIADGPKSFEGKQLTRSREVVTLKCDGGVPVISISSKYFDAADAIYKIVFNSGVSYLPIEQSPLPSSPHIGDAGTLGIFEGCDGSTVTVTWSLKAAYQGWSVLVVTSVVSDGMDASMEVDSYLLDPAGIPSTITLSATSLGTTVTLTGNRCTTGIHE